MNEAIANLFTSRSYSISIEQPWTSSLGGVSLRGAFLRDSVDELHGVAERYVTARQLAPPSSQALVAARQPPSPSQRRIVASQLL